MRLRNKPWTNSFLENNKEFLIQWNWVEPIKLNDVFKNNNPIELEIGCGKGQFITTHAISNSDKNFIGMEKEITVVGVALKNTLNKAKDSKTLTNLKYFNIYAENLLSLFEENSIDKIYLNFSDPWPKARHAKRRLTYISFLEMYAKILKTNGIIEIKTDQLPLYEFTIEQLESTDKFIILEKTVDLYKDKKMVQDNVPTEYETKFHAQGDKITKLILKKTS